jgi:hypothetical protein
MIVSGAAKILPGKILIAIGQDQGCNWVAKIESQEKAIERTRLIFCNSVAKID